MHLRSTALIVSKLARRRHGKLAGRKYIYGSMQRAVVSQLSVSIADYNKEISQEGEIETEATANQRQVIDLHRIYHK